MCNNAESNSASGGTSSNVGFRDNDATMAIEQNRARQQSALDVARGLNGPGAGGGDTERAVAQNRAAQEKALEQNRARVELADYRSRVNTARGFGLPGPVKVDDASGVAEANANVSRGLGAIRDVLGGYDRTISPEAYREAAIMGQVDTLTEQLSSGNVHFENGKLKDDNLGRVMDIAAVPASFVSPVGMMTSGQRGLPVANVGVVPGVNAVKNLASLVLNDKQRSALIDAGLLDEERVEKPEPDDGPREGGEPFQDQQQRIQVAQASRQPAQRQPQARGLNPAGLHTAALSARRFGRG